MLPGRPLKFATPELLDEKIEQYFAQVKENDGIPTISELALFLDTSRKTLCEYKERDGFSNSIKKALDKCEAFIEKGMLQNKLNVTASIFNLKNNYGWVDKTETDVTSGGEKLQVNTILYANGNNSSQLSTTELPATDTPSVG